MNTTSALLSDPNLAYINAGVRPRLPKGGDGITRTSNWLKRYCNRTTTTFLLAKIHPTPGSYQLQRGQKKERLIKNHKDRIRRNKAPSFPRKQQIPRRVPLTPEYFTEGVLDSQRLEDHSTTRCDVPGDPISLTRSTDTGRKKKKPKRFTFQDVAPKLTLIFVNKPSSGESVPRVDCKTPGLFFFSCQIPS